MPRCVLALGPDAAGSVLADLIAAATARIDAAVYEVGPSYAALLGRAARRGVAVRLLLDAHAGANTTSVRLLQGIDAHCRVIGGHPGVEAHWKLLLVDGATVALGSGNLIHRDAPAPGLPGTREWWATVSDASALVAAARHALDAAWREAAEPPLAWRRAVAVAFAAPPVGVPRPEVPPLSLEVPEASLRLCVGGAAVAAELAARIGTARDRVLVTVPYVHTHVAAVASLLDALQAARARGAEVRLLLGTVPEPRDAEALRSVPTIEVRVMDPLRCTTGHAKGLVADGAAVVGSANWSGTGLGSNREAALTVDDPHAADWFAAALDRDWQVSRPL
ncbi:MAG TPA: phospholipase D-like domain-containing protein [Candidatus Angelobacter sp.]|nr:phospholipase D-like domain-containing protein [Candidatus Angelobacter sp.]